jgi:hypothetical protein
MKIKTEHYKEMLDVLSKVDKDAARKHKKELKKDARVKDIEKRFRWDLLYAAKLSPWICDNLYPYLNDSHIDTALKSIVNELEL